MSFSSPAVSAGEHRYFLYTPELHLMAETELTSAPHPIIDNEYIWFDGIPVAQQSSTGETRWTFTDHLGTPILQTSSLQGIVWRAEYEPYGRIFELRAQDVHQPLRLPGQEAEQLSAGANGATDRSYNIHRWYESGVGRYAEPDPLTLRSSVWPYSYAQEQPTRILDPLGLTVVTVNCTAGEVAQIQSAAQAAEAKGKTCLPCGDRAPFRAKIQNLTVKCTSLRYLPRSGKEFCGKAFGYGYRGQYIRYQHQIDLSPPAFDPKSPFHCGCLKGLILHEVTHLIGYEDAPGPRNAYDTAKKCFSCAKSNPFVVNETIDVH